MIQHTEDTITKTKTEVPEVRLKSQNYEL